MKNIITKRTAAYLIGIMTTVMLCFAGSSAAQNKTKNSACKSKRTFCDSLDWADRNGINNIHLPKIIMPNMEIEAGEYSLDAVYAILKDVPRDTLNKYYGIAKQKPVVTNDILKQH